MTTFLFPFAKLVSFSFRRMRKCSSGKGWVLALGIVYIVLEVGSLELSEAEKGRVRQLIEWFPKKAISDKMEIVAFYDDVTETELRGVGAKEDIEPGELLFRVPEDLTITERTVYNCDELFTLFMRSYTVTPLHETALFILFEKWKITHTDQGSFWEPWIQILPTSLTTTIFWTEEELEELKGSSLLEFTRRKEANMRRQYGYLVEDLQDFVNITAPQEEGLSTKEFWRFITDPSVLSYQDFKWVLSIIWSRSFSLLLDEGRAAGLIPFADMFNNPSDTLRRYENMLRVQIDSETGDLLYFCRTGVKKGEQIYTFYGRESSFSNAQLLLEYGFTLAPTNPNDLIMINIPLNKDDPYYETKLDVLERSGFIPGHYRVFRSQQLPPLNVIAALRFQLALPDELTTARLALERREYAKGLNMRNERAVYRQLEIHLRHMIDAYPTTLEEDKELLLDHLQGRKKLSVNHRAAIRVRAGEKEIIEGLLKNVAETRAALFEVDTSM